jgi:hypothetical protein
LKTEVAKLSVDLVKKNKPQFLDLTQDETDSLLRKLLIAKLAPKKPKKKSKFKLRQPSSSDESSDSD